MDFLCKLCPPPELRLERKVKDTMWVDEESWYHVAPKWSLLLDILIDPKTREFLGLTFYFPSEWRNVVEKALSKTDRNMVRYADTRIARYADLEPDTGFYEIVWADRTDMEIWTASLDAEFWYVARENNEELAVGLAILGVESVLDHHALIMPKEFSVKVSDHRR